MARSSPARPISSRKTATRLSAKSAQVPPAPRPGGKLGVIIDRLGAKTGATADELVAATGWQRHSVLGALSRLRSRGFAISLDISANRNAYRLDGTAKSGAQLRQRG